MESADCEGDGSHEEIPVWEHVSKWKECLTTVLCIQDEGEVGRRLPKDLATSEFSLHFCIQLKEKDVGEGALIEILSPKKKKENKRI